MIRLRVWANELPMGWFGHEAGQYFFQYHEDWLNSGHAYVLAPQFVLRPEPHWGESVKIFFANLLPEGAALEEILSAIRMRAMPTHSKSLASWVKSCPVCCLCVHKASCLLGGSNTAY